jgi:hypothetical protein
MTPFYFFYYDCGINLRGFNYQLSTPNHLRLILLENAITLSRIELEFMAMDSMSDDRHDMSALLR